MTTLATVRARIARITERLRARRARRIRAYLDGRFAAVAGR